MATQLTLTSVPNPPVDPNEVDSVLSRPVDDDALHAATKPVRRAPGHSGWLDRRTISSGRKGVAAARAALADATRRVAERESVAELDRQRDLARLAGGVGRSGSDSSMSGPSTHTGGSDRHAA